MNITRGKISMAQKVLLYGQSGVGKTTFATKFPDPLFVDTEGGTRNFDVARVIPESWKDLEDIVKEVNAKPDICGTLVIDSLDWAERLCIDAVLREHKRSSIETWDFGKGYVFVLDKIRPLMNVCSEIVEKGTNVVIICHCQNKTIKLPEELGAYDMWTLKLSNKVAAFVKEWADAALFATYKTVLVDVKNKKGTAQGGKVRILRCNHDATWDAKNRWGLPDEIDMKYERIAQFIPSRQATPPTQPAAPALGEQVEYEKALIMAAEIIQSLETAEQATAAIAAIKGLPHALNSEREAKQALHNRATALGFKFANGKYS
jgi:hypothetical protein